jgi:hypothetical protein
MSMRRCTLLPGELDVGSLHLCSALQCPPASTRPLLKNWRRRDGKFQGMNIRTKQYAIIPRSNSQLLAQQKPSSQWCPQAFPITMQHRKKHRLILQVGTHDRERQRLGEHELPGATAKLPKFNYLIAPRHAARRPH